MSDINMTQCPVGVAMNINLGKKHICSCCGTKYYDLQRSTPCCPKCGKEPDDETNLPSVVEDIQMLEDAVEEKPDLFKDEEEDLDEDPDYSTGDETEIEEEE